MANVPFINSFSTSMISSELHFDIEKLIEYIRGTGLQSALVSDAVG